MALLVAGFLPVTSSAASAAGEVYQAEALVHTWVNGSTRSVPLLIALDAGLDQVTGVELDMTFQAPTLRCFPDASATYDFSDLGVVLVSPSGTAVTLVRDGAAGAPTYTWSGADYSGDFQFSDAAASPVGGMQPPSGPVRPEEPLSTFDGELAAGVWTVVVSDREAGDGAFCIGMPVLRVTAESPAPTTTTIADAAVVYGEGLTATVEASSGGAVDGGTVEFLHGTASLGTAPVAGGVATLTGHRLSVRDSPAAVTVRFTPPPGYAPSESTTAVTVTPATLRVVAEDQQITYGDPVPPCELTVQGLQDGDEAEDVLPPTGDVCTPPDAAAARPGATASYVVDDPTVTSPDYTATAVSGTLTVTKAPLTVSAGDVSLDYGEPVPATFPPTYTGWVGGDDAASALTAEPTCTADVPAGSPLGDYAITCAGAASDWYQPGYEPATLTIAPATTVTEITDGPRTYGDGIAATVRDADGGPVDGGSVEFRQDGELLGSAPVVDGLAELTENGPTVNGGPVTASFVPPAGVAGSQDTESVDVDPAPLTVSAVDQHITYGDAVPACELAYDGLRYDDEAQQVGAEVLCAPPTDQVYEPGDVPPYETLVMPVNPRPGTLLPNYDVSAADGTLTVGKAPLTVSAEDVSVGDGDPVPATVPATYGGWVSSDDPSALTTPATCRPSAGDGSGAGTYEIVCAGAASDLYAPVYEPATLTIDAADPPVEQAAAQQPQQAPAVAEPAAGDDLPLTGPGSSPLALGALGLVLLLTGGLALRYLPGRRRRPAA